MIEFLNNRLEVPEKDLANSRINVYNVAEKDIPFNLTNIIEYYDGGKNYICIIDYDKNNKFEKFQRHYKNGVVQII